MDVLKELENSINQSLENMRRQLEWDEMQAAEMDEAGRIDDMYAYDRSAAARREDISHMEALLVIIHRGEKGRPTSDEERGKGEQGRQGLL